MVNTITGILILLFGIAFAGITLRDISKQNWTVKAWTENRRKGIAAILLILVGILFITGVMDISRVTPG